MPTSDQTAPSPITFIDDFNATGIANCQGQDVVSCRGVAIDAKTLRKSDEIRLPEWDEVFKADESNEGDSFPGYLTRMFECSNESSTAAFTFKTGKSPLTVNGYLHLADGRIFNLENCGKKCHVWMEIKISADENATDVIDAPSTGSRSLVEIERENMLLRKGIEDRNSIAWVSVVIYVTYDFYYQTPDFWGFMAEMFNKANDGFRRSGVNIRVWLHCAYFSGVTDAPNSNTMLNEFFYSRYSGSRLI